MHADKPLSVCMKGGGGGLIIFTGTCADSGFSVINCAALAPRLRVRIPGPRGGYGGV